MLLVHFILDVSRVAPSCPFAQSGVTVNARWYSTKKKGVKCLFPVYSSVNCQVFRKYLLMNF